jgi:hypothetical protein
VIVATPRLGKHVPVARQQILSNVTVGLQQWKRGVSTWSVPRCYKQGTRSIQSQFCKGGCEERNSAREAEESPLVEAVARERLEKA